MSLFLIIAILSIPGLTDNQQAFSNPAPLKQHIPTLTDSLSDKSVAREGPRFMVLPIIFSSPDTRLAFGILPQLIFRTSSSSNPSSVRMDTYYTQNRQYHILIRPTFWFRNDNISLTGKLSLKKWPTSFYGIGNNTKVEEREKFTETLYDASLEGITRVGPGYFAGLSYSLRYARISAHNNDGVLASGSVTGNGNTFVSSVKAVFKQDTRNNHFYPSKGSYHTLEIMAAPKLLGSNLAFTQYTLDLRKYLSVYGGHVLALRSTLSTSAGNVPFRMLPSVGSSLRGYSTVRYIDRSLAAFQLEYRVVPLAWRVGFTVFAGIAEVFNRPNDIAFNNLKYALGFGLRYQFSRAEKINIRIDYGVGRDSSGDYIDLNEAF